MKIVADESVDFGIINYLRNAGYSIIAIAETSPGIPDAQVLKIAVLNKALLITEDKDFGELTFRLRLDHYGILLIRLSNLKREERIDLASQIIQLHFNKLKNQFSVLTKQGLRIKPSSAI
jgi:predicted nuclease of predicted toxin-antitoxin system